LCRDVLEYPYSTLPGLLGRSKLIIPMAEDITLFSDVEGTVKWLNTPPHTEDWRAIGRALRKREFKLTRQNHKFHRLELDTL
jgi:hypothetical protein